MFNVRKGQLIKTNDENTSVEQAMWNVKVNGDNLLLGMEQGSGKHVNNVQVVVNPMRERETTS